MSYYVSRVAIATDTPKGVKWVSETYLIDAVSVTHAEELISSKLSQLELVEFVKLLNPKIHKNGKH